MKKTTGIFLLAALPLVASDTGLKSFFTTFVPLFAKTDHATLIEKKMVEFPLILKGTLDDSPEVKLAARNFAAVLPKIASQMSGLNAKNYTESEAEHLSAMTKSGRFPEDAGEGTVRAGNLVFAKKRSGWRLIKVYTSDELIAQFGKMGN